MKYTVVKLSEAQPDLEAQHDELQATCYVWHKNAATMRVTIVIGGRSRMFDVTKRGIRERRN